MKFDPRMTHPIYDGTLDFSRSTHALGVLDPSFDAKIHMNKLCFLRIEIVFIKVFEKSPQRGDSPKYVMPAVNRQPGDRGGTCKEGNDRKKKKNT